MPWTAPWTNPWYRPCSRPQCSPWTTPWARVPWKPAMDDAMASSMDEQMVSYIDGSMNTRRRHQAHPVFVPIIILERLKLCGHKTTTRIRCNAVRRIWGNHLYLLPTFVAGMAHTAISTPQTPTRSVTWALGGFKNNEIVNDAFIPSLPLSAQFSGSPHRSR